MTALKTSGSGLMEVEEEKQKIRRSPSIPLPEWNDERKEQLAASTVYVKGNNTHLFITNRVNRTAEGSPKNYS